MNFAWLQEKSVTYSVEGGFARTVWLRLLAETGSSFSRLPSIQSTMLNLVSLLAPQRCRLIRCLYFRT